MVVNFYGKPDRKWYHVIVFFAMPQENPHTSGEGKEYARFLCQGDAWIYARNLLSSVGEVYPKGMIAIR